MPFLEYRPSQIHNKAHQHLLWHCPCSCHQAVRRLLYDAGYITLEDYEQREALIAREHPDYLRMDVADEPSMDTANPTRYKRAISLSDDDEHL